MASPSTCRRTVTARATPTRTSSIPETVDVVDVHKGPYSARFGDFYTAGAMELKTIDKIDGPTIWIAGGAPLAGPRALENYNRRIVGMASPPLGDEETAKSLIAVQLGDTDGPFGTRRASSRATRSSSTRMTSAPAR